MTTNRIKEKIRKNPNSFIVKITLIRLKSDPNYNELIRYKNAYKITHLKRSCGLA